MPKGYVTNWKQRKEPKEERHIVDVWFDSHGEKAMVYDTKQEAENDAALLTKLQVVIPSSEGGKHTCRHFQVEELGPSEFVVFCEGPFIIRESDSNQGKGTAS
jgi:hypothetical protein